MKLFAKLIRSCGLLSRRCRYIAKSHKPLQGVPTKLLEFNSDVCIVRNMAQKSITSFFKITPKKTDVKEEKRDEEDSHSKDKASPVSSKTEKRSSKRQRLESSGSEAESPQKHKHTTPESVEKISKVKRLQIESSESESEIPQSPDEIPLKTNGSKSPNTYDSPKTKKVKVKKEKTPPKATNGDVSTKRDGKRSKSKSPEKKEIVKKKMEGLDKKVMIKMENLEGDENRVKVADTDYDPSKSKYHPVHDACWGKGEPVPYLALAKTFEAIEAISARLKIVEILGNYFRSVIALTPADLLPSVYLCLNQLAPAYHSLELGIAETYLMKAIGQCTGRTLAQVKAAAAKTGDLGLVAEQARSTQRTMFTPGKLVIEKVYAKLKEIALMTGQASVNKKIAVIQTLFVACRNCEAKFLIRSLEGKLRIGLAEQSVLQALALACAATPPDPEGPTTLDVASTMTKEQFKARVDEHALLIKTTYCECPNYDAIVPVLLQHGVAALPQHCRLTPGVPLRPMLAHPTKGVHEIFDRFESIEFTCEWKYDGERAQIHVPGDEAPALHRAAIFSRNQENNTSKYPDVLRRLPSLLKESVRSCVLDCEAVAYDTANNKILPFQILSTRKRKGASDSEITVQVCVFVFDLLYLNGASLVNEPLRTRRDLLRTHFNVVEGEWQFATHKDCSSMEEVSEFLEAAVRGSCEGLMVKTLVGEHARYDIARRSRNWLKLKKDYLEGVGDTLDVLVLGGYLGRGKRAGVYGGFLLACYDADSEEYQTLCKIGTGFSDEDLHTLSATLRDHVIDAPRSYYRYDSSHAPDVWFSARSVWEVRCADLSLSPAHRAAIGLVDPDKGISLRFPRFVRVRDDKSPEQATSARQVAQLYLNQDQVKNQTNKVTIDDDFY